MDAIASPALQAFGFYAGIAGLLIGVALARRTVVAGAPVVSADAFWGPLGIAALGAAFAAASPEPLTLTAGALLLTGLAFLAAAPHRQDWTPPGRRLGLVLVAASMAVALAGAFISGPQGPHSGS